LRDTADCFADRAVFPGVGDRGVVVFDLSVFDRDAFGWAFQLGVGVAGVGHCYSDAGAEGWGVMNNVALLRRISMISMGVAVIAGSVSLVLLFARISNDKTLFFISIAALVIGFIVDRRVGKLDDRNAG
jgi:hypothetical protein